MNRIKQFFEFISPQRHILIIIILVLFLNCSVNKSISSNQNPSNIQIDSNNKYNELIAGLEKFIPMMMDEVSIPGLSIALINKSGIIWQGNFGIESVKTNTPIDDSTVFVAASFSKVVFAYLVMKMVDKQKIDLDTPLIHYAPKSYIEKEFKKIKDDRFNKITARMVLIHSTGFPDFRLFGKSVKMKFTPGRNFSYSGEAFYLLQKIVEYIEGKPINEIMQKYVFNPIGMTNSSYVYEERFKNRLAKGHGHWLSFLFNWKMLKNSNAHAERSLLTTTEDYAKFLAALMNGFGLSSRTYHEMLMPHINANSNYIFWGLGIGIEIVDEDTTYWHDGEGMIFQDYFAFTNQGIGFVYFSNSSNGLSIGERITEIIIGNYHPSFRWLGIEQYDFQ